MYFEVYQWVLKVINTEKKAVKKQITHISSLSFKLWFNIEILTYVITSILISSQGNMPYLNPPGYQNLSIINEDLSVYLTIK